MRLRSGDGKHCRFAKGRRVWILLGYLSLPLNQGHGVVKLVKLSAYPIASLSAPRYYTEGTREPDAG